MVWLFLLFFADFDATFRAGLMALNQNNLAVAEQQLEAASKLQPQDSRVWLALAQTYWKLHKLPPAQAAAKNAETFAKDNNVLHALAFYYSETADYSKAADFEARYAASVPDAVPLAAELYLRAGKPKPAIEMLRKSLAAADRAELHSLLGKAYEADGDSAHAIAEYRVALVKDKFAEGYYFDLAQAQLRKQDFAAALETLDAGRRTFAKSAQLELAAGVAYYGLRRFPEAIDTFLRTIRMDPSVEQPYIFLGRMLDQAEDKRPQIAAAFAALAKAAPSNYLGAFLYGKLLASEDPTQAEILLRKSITANPKYWESHFELGLLLDQRKQYDEAAREIRRGIELNPKEPAPHYRLSRLYDRLGKSAEAQAERELHAKLTTAGPVINGMK